MLLRSLNARSSGQKSRRVFVTNHMSPFSEFLHLVTEQAKSCTTTTTVLVNDTATGFERDSSEKSYSIFKSIGV